MAQVFSCEFCKISKNTFFIEHLRVTASVYVTSGLKFASFMSAYSCKNYVLNFKKHKLDPQKIAEAISNQNLFQTPLENPGP